MSWPTSDDAVKRTIRDLMDRVAVLERHSHPSRLIDELGGGVEWCVAAYDGAWEIASANVTETVEFDVGFDSGGVLTWPHTGDNSRIGPLEDDYLYLLVTHGQISLSPSGNWGQIVVSPVGVYGGTGAIAARWFRAASGDGSQRAVSASGAAIPNPAQPQDKYVTLAVSATIDTAEFNQPTLVVAKFGPALNVEVNPAP